MTKKIRSKADKLNVFANAYKGGIGNAFDDKRCLSCPAALACITKSLEKQIGECGRCGKLVATVELDFPDAHWDFSKLTYRVKRQKSPIYWDFSKLTYRVKRQKSPIYSMGSKNGITYLDEEGELKEIRYRSRESYIPKWCPKAKITTEVACDKCCEKHEDLPF